MGTDAPGGDDRAAAPHGHWEHELELAHLVTAVDRTGAVVALHPETVLDGLHDRGQTIGEWREGNQVSQAWQPVEERAFGDR
jgi:hypothetical protein